MVWSGGFSLTREAFTHFGSAGAETRVAGLVGVIAGVGVLVTSMLAVPGVGVVVGGSETLVSDSPAWTVCATAVEMADSWEEPQAETSKVMAISTARILYERRADIKTSFP